MRLPRVFRTSSFRLTLLYAGLFGVSVLVLLGVILLSGSAYIAGEIDRNVANEIAEIRADADGTGLAGLRATVAALSRKAPAGVYYLLEDANGRVLAGNMPAIAPTEGVMTLPAPAKLRLVARTEHGVRGRGVRLADKAYLFVGLDDFQLREMREMVTRSFLWVLVTTVALALGGGIVMSLGVLRRIEAVSQASREIMAGDLARRLPVRGADDEFDHLATSVNAMLDRIAALMDGLRQVSSDIAHDLRTPLTRLRQRLELARRRGETVAGLQTALDGSIADVDAILDTFSALLRIAQIEAHTKSSAFTAVDLSDLLQGIAEAYETAAEEHGQVLDIAVPAGLTVPGDRELLPQLFANLVENSIRHCPAGTRIEIAARTDRSGIEIEVADTGPGIPAAFREKVFQRFFRLERSRTTPGTGLGLSLAAAIATLHGARLSLHDNAPGLRVRVLFPPASEAAAAMGYSGNKPIASPTENRPPSTTSAYTPRSECP